MDINPVKRALAERRASIGCWLTLASPANAELLAHCGFDWLLVDQEHGPGGSDALLQQLRAIDAARGQGSRVGVIVRVAGHDPEQVKQAMDSGAPCLMFPTVDSAEQARHLAAAMRYPEGDNGGCRGIAGIVRAARYGLDSRYLAEANAQAATIVQIETARGVEQARAIARVDGVDCLFIGPADLSFGLGHPGDLAHPRVRAAIDEVLAAAAEAGKACGIFAASADQAQQFRRAGFHLIGLHSDAAWLARGARAALAEYRAEHRPGG